MSGAEVGARWFVSAGILAPKERVAKGCDWWPVARHPSHNKRTLDIRSMSLLIVFYEELGDTIKVS